MPKQLATVQIRDDIKILHQQGYVFAKLIEVFKRFECKKITRRMLTAAKEAMPHRLIIYDKSKHSGITILYVWGVGIPYRMRMRIYIGYVEYLEELMYSRNYSYAATDAHITLLKGAETKLGGWQEEWHSITEQVKRLRGRMDGFKAGHYIDWKL